MHESTGGVGTKITMAAPLHKANRRLQLAVFLLLLLFTAFAAPSAARAATAPVEPASDDRGVYLLSEPGHLFWFGKTVNGGSAEINAKLTKDVDLSEGGSPSHWTPIGQYTSGDRKDNGYAGSFDGGGFTVSGYIVASADVVSADIDVLAAGFFGLVGQSADIRGLTVGGVVSVDISGSTNYIYAGGIAGYNYGMITDCANNGEVSASGSSTYNYAGGIAGLNNGTITNSIHSGGNVSATGGKTNYAGGIAGNNGGMITNCTHSGSEVSASGGSNRNYVGGIVGYNNTSGGNISNSCWAASGDLKAVGNDTIVSADVVSLDAAAMQRVVTTVLPVERSLFVALGGSAPALISYPGTADDMTGYFSVSGDISVASPEIADISDRWPCTVSGIKQGTTMVSFDIDLRATDFSSLGSGPQPVAESCLTVPHRFTVTVGEEIPVAEVSLDLTELTLNIGESKKLTAAVKPDDATDKAVTWTSADPAVAEVDDNGKVTALSAGTTVITAKADSKSATCTVTVAKQKRGGSSHGCAAGLGTLSMLTLIPLWLRRKKR